MPICATGAGAGGIADRTAGVSTGDCATEDADGTGVGGCAGEIGVGDIGSAGAADEAVPVSAASAIGQPQCGQDSALSLTLPPHSLHVLNAIANLPASRRLRILCSRDKSRSTPSGPDILVTQQGIRSLLLRMVLFGPSATWSWARHVRRFHTLRFDLDQTKL